MLLSGYHVRINMIVTPRAQESAARAAAGWMQDAAVPTAKGLRPRTPAQALVVQCGGPGAEATSVAASGSNAIASPLLLFAFQQIKLLKSVTVK